MPVDTTPFDNHIVYSRDVTRAMRDVNALQANFALNLVRWWGRQRGAYDVESGHFDSEIAGAVMASTGAVYALDDTGHIAEYGADGQLTNVFFAVNPNSDRRVDFDRLWMDSSDRLLLLDVSQQYEFYQFNLNGVEQWSTTLSSDGVAWAVDTDDDGVYFAEWENATDGGNAPGYQHVVRKLTGAGGGQSWATTVEILPGDGTEFASAQRAVLAARPGGGVVLVQQGLQEANDVHYIRIQAIAADGTLGTHTPAHEGSGAAADYADDVDEIYDAAVDENGDVWVSYSARSANEVYLARIAGDDGKLAWSENLNTAYNLTKLTPPLLSRDRAGSEVYAVGGVGPAIEVRALDGTVVERHPAAGCPGAWQQPAAWLLAGTYELPVGNHLYPLSDGVLIGPWELRDGRTVDGEAGSGATLADTPRGAELGGNPYTYAAAAAFRRGQTRWYSYNESGVIDLGTPDAGATTPGDNALVTAGADYALNMIHDLRWAIEALSWRFESAGGNQFGFVNDDADSDLFDGPVAWLSDVRDVHGEFAQVSSAHFSGGKHYSWVRSLAFGAPSSRVVGTDNHVYRCIAEHRSSAATTPVTGGAWASVWKRMTYAPALNDEVPLSDIPQTLGRHNRLFARTEESDGRYYTGSVNFFGARIAHWSEIADPAGWASGIDYALNTIVTGLDGRWYRCVAPHRSSGYTAPPSGAAAVRVWAVHAFAALPWAEGTSYSQGDVVWSPFFEDTDLLPPDRKRSGHRWWHQYGDGRLYDATEAHSATASNAPTPGPEAGYYWEALWHRGNEWQSGQAGHYYGLIRGTDGRAWAPVSSGVGDSAAERPTIGRLAGNYVLREGPTPRWVGRVFPWHGQIFHEAEMYAAGDLALGTDGKMYRARRAQGANNVDLRPVLRGGEQPADVQQLPASGNGTIETSGSFDDWPFMPLGGGIHYVQIRKADGSEREIVGVNERDATTLTVVSRGEFGTTPSAGASDDSVYPPWAVYWEHAQLSSGGPWSPTASYSAGDVVTGGDGHLYRCHRAHSQALVDAQPSRGAEAKFYWRLITAADAPLWSDGAAYSAFQWVFGVDGDLYQARFAHTATEDKLPRVGNEWRTYWFPVTGQNWKAEFDAGRSFNAGSPGVTFGSWIVPPDVVSAQDGRLFACIQGHAPAYSRRPHAGRDWKTLWQVADDMAFWAEGSTYAIGDIVVGHDWWCYRCRRPHTATSARRPSGHFKYDYEPDSMPWRPNDLDAQAWVSNRWYRGNAAASYVQVDPAWVYRAGIDRGSLGVYRATQGHFFDGPDDDAFEDAAAAAFERIADADPQYVPIARKNQAPAGDRVHYYSDALMAIDIHEIRAILDGLLAGSVVDWRL